MTQRDGNKVVTLDDLLELVETAARRIESLQAANAALAKQVRAAEAALEAARQETQEHAQRTAMSEQEAASLRRDAEWCRWFRNKYQDSTFYSHIERDFRKECLGEKISDDVSADIRDDNRAPGPAS